MKKRVLSLILCGVMLLSAVPMGPLAEVFTIEAFAGDVSELRKVFDTVPDEDDWDLYMNTDVLEAYYKSAKWMLAAPGLYSQSDIDELTADLKAAVDNLKFHTQSISISDSSLSLETGKSATLKVTLNPESAGDEVRWSSNNAACVSVERISDREAKISVNKF